MSLVTGDPLRENGLVKAGALAPLPATVSTVKVNSDSYFNTIIDLKWVPRINILTHIEGSGWVVDYYSQVLNTDSNLSGQQFTKNPVYQSYTLIKNMEMKVSTPLASSQDAESKAMIVTGTSLLYPFLIPNEGDMFTADIGEGKLGIFRVTDSIKKSIFKESCYEISYGLDSDDNQDNSVDLNQKVIKTYYFHKDFLNYGQNPLLINSDNDILISLYKTYKTLTAQYFKRFFSNEFQTLILPSQIYTTYDHFLTNYLLDEFSTRDSLEIKHIRRLNLDDDDVMKSDSLWTALKLKDISYLNTCFNKAGLVNSRLFTKDPVLEGIYYTGINKTIYPIDPILTVDYLQDNKSKMLDIEQLTPSIASDNKIIRSVNLRGNFNVYDSIYTVTIDNYYILSSNFYNKTNTQSPLEIMVWDYLENKPIDYTQLSDTAKVYFKWGILEQFYYIPIILTMIRSVIRGL